jgi:hypothetical protein
MTDDEIKEIRALYDRGYTTTVVDDIPWMLDEIERLRTFIRMIAAFEGEWQADAQEVLAAGTEEKP